MRSAVHHSVACGSPESEVLGGLVEVHIHFTPVRPIVVSESLTSPRNLCCVRTNFILLLFLFLCFKFFFLFLALLDLCCCSGFSLVLSSGGYSLAAVLGFSSRWLPFLQSTGSRARGLQRLWLQALEPGSVVVARGLRCSAARGVFPDQELNVLAGGLNTLTGACPALAGGFFTVEPTGKSSSLILD